MNAPQAPQHTPYDPHAHECYSCEFGSQPPAHTKQCRGCINKEDRPRWVPKAQYAEMAAIAITLATGA